MLPTIQRRIALAVECENASWYAFMRESRWKRMHELSKIPNANPCRSLDHFSGLRQLEPAYANNNPYRCANGNAFTQRYTNAISNLYGNRYPFRYLHTERDAD